MYLTPGMMVKEFEWETKSTTLNARRQAQLSWVTAGQIHGILSDSTPAQKIQYQQIQANVTHQIAVNAAPQAKAEDRLSLGDRHFYVRDVQDPGGFGLWTLYMVEERLDV
ncbi:hypothetical protein AAC03nite_20180 [Alicyclobacillus acidoterrestris]|nr:hypothetical protein AAC03nite_20180 [Alicyclobacillus acidoterrestris]